MTMTPGPGDENGFRVTVLRGLSPDRERCEAELLAGGVPLAALQRSVWAREFGGESSWFLAARKASGECQAGVAIDVARSRAVPGHLLLRVQRCGPARTGEATRATLSALADLARRNPRVLRVSVELFSTDPDFRGMAGRWLAGLGFRLASEPRSYPTTLALDLSPSEAAIFALLSQDTRRKIRAISKRGWELRPISDAALGDRMEVIRRVTLDRTGGAFVRRNWRSAIGLSADHLRMARLTGLFRSERDTPDSLLAYAWGVNNVSHVQYHTAAAVRDPDLKAPLGYGLMWDLICWAKRVGAEWFDLGGVTAGHFGDKEDPLGGVSDFKRAFSKNVVQVGEEWEWEPHPARAKLARLVSRAAHLFSGRRGSPPGSTI